MLTVEEFRTHLDLAMLAPDLQKADIDKAVEDAAKYQVATLNLNSTWVEYANKRFVELGSEVRASAVIGFPYGACIPEVKFLEAREMMKLGVNALDMVVNIGAVKDGNWDLVKYEIEEFVKIADGKAATKVIYEVAFLTIEQIEKLTRICCEAGVDYAKTATGTQAFPDLEQVQAMQRNLSGKTKIKVSGVPRTFTLGAVLYLFNNFDVDLVGTRSACKLIEQYKEYLENHKEE